MANRAAMTAEEAAEWGKTLDFPTVWAALMESREKADQRSAEADRRHAELDKYFKEMEARMDRTSEEIKQTTEELNRMFERVDRVMANVGGLNRSVGELIETLIAARLWEKFAGFRYNFKRAYRRVPIYDETNRARTDIDILLSNTEWCMAVEVKREADEKDVEHHLRRMQLIRQYPPLEIVGKKMLGAIAGGVVPPDAAEAAFKAGFYVLELTGESVTLLPPPDYFAPREW
jgi:hypothetical protein